MANKIVVEFREVGEVPQAFVGEVYMRDHGWLEVVGRPLSATPTYPTLGEHLNMWWPKERIYAVSVEADPSRYNTK